MGKEEGKTGVHVVDRRRFDATGEERPAGNDAKAEERPMKEDNPVNAGGTPANEAGVPEISFSSFLISLATQAMMQLGQMTAPEGLDLPVDKTAAKQTIDLISMLEVKTRGNRDEEEDRLIEEILHSLRLSYVAR